MAYQSYRIGEPTLNINGNKPVDPDDLKVIAANGFGQASEMLASDVYRNTQVMKGLYRPWPDVKNELKSDYKIVSVINSNDFKLPLLLEEDQTSFVEEQKLLTQLGMFKTYFIVILRPSNGSDKSEYIIVGCTDERTLKESTKPETKATTDSRKPREPWQHRKLSPQELVDMIDEKEKRDSYEKELAQQEIDRIRDSLFNDPSFRSRNDAWRYELRLDKRPGYRKPAEVTEEPKPPVSVNNARFLSENPQYCFAISHFSADRMFASDRVTLEPSEVFMPKERKSPRFEVSQAELNRLPMVYTSKKMPYALTALYTTVLVLWVASGSWILAIVFLPLVAAYVTAVARSTRDTQLTYLKAKHAILPRKVWQIEE